MDHRARYSRLTTSLLAVLLLLVVPVAAWAEPLGNHISVKLIASPERPVAGQDTRLTIILTDARQQLISNASVSISVERATAASAGGHAGMHVGNNQPAGATLRVAAKATENKGEYVATLKLPEEGRWGIMVTAGDATAHLDVDAVKPQASSSSSAATAPPVASAARKASASVAPMEAIHASYLDLSANISDLRTRVGEWQKGNEDSLKIAEEKLERIEAVLGSISWPGEMATSTGKTRAALGPVGTALKARDQAGAETAAKALGDASHDVTHEFYPDWLPALKDAGFSLMAPHAIYLDLNANVSDLGSRLEAWQKGDEGSLNIAKEKVERIGILVPHMYSTGVAVKPVRAIEKGLPAMEAALEKKDGPAAQTALKSIVDASQYLARDIYSWMHVTAGSGNPVCVQASYLDLSSHISALRTRVGEWQKGNEDSLKMAEQRLERIEVVLAHAEWPGAMAASIGKTEAAIDRMAKALKAKDAAGAETEAKALGDASDDVTHAYYADWLPGAQLDKAVDQIGSIQGNSRSAGAGSHGGGHGAESGVPSYWFVGSTVGIVFTTIGLVPILRRRELGAKRAEVS